MKVTRFTEFLTYPMFEIFIFPDNLYALVSMGGRSQLWKKMMGLGRYTLSRKRIFIGQQSKKIWLKVKRRLPH